MSSHTVGRNDADENLNIALNRTNITGSHHPYSSQWMGHWMRPSSNSMPEIGKTCTVPDKGKNSEVREAKMLSIEVMRSNISEYRALQFSEPGRKYIHSDILQQAGKGIVDDKKNYSLRNNDSLTESGALLRDMSSTNNLPGSSVDWKKFDACHFLNSEKNMGSEWNHFPMFNINQKIECILSSKKKSNFGTMAVSMTESQFWNSESVLASHSVKFASEEHRLQLWSNAQSTDQGASSSKSAEDSPGNQVDHSGPGFNFHRLNMASPMYTRKQVNPISSKPPCDNLCAKTSHTHSEHDQYNCSQHSTFPPSEMKDGNQMIGRISSQFKNKTVQLRTTCYRDGISFPILIHECDNEMFSGSKTLSPSHCNPGLSKLKSELKSLRQHKMQQFSDSAQYYSFTKKAGMDLSDRDKMIEEPTSFTAAKGTTLIEATALPTMLQCHERRTASLKLLENSNSSEDKDGPCINPNFVKKQLESSVKTDKLHTDASQSPSCSAGVNSSRRQKGVVIFPQQTSSLVKEAIVRNAETDMLEVNRHLKVSEIRDTSTSRTESMGEDHFLYHVNKKDNSESTQPVDSSLCPESSNQWLKRLRRDPSECFAHGTKRLKLADALGSGRGYTLYNEVLNCEGSSSNLPSSSKEQKEPAKAIVLKEKGECSSEEPAKEVHSWIRRWCHGSQQTAPQVSQALPMLKSAKAVPERTEGKQLPSLAAMALMGKAVNSFRPCEFQRKGSSVVWNIEEL
ncbi:hypothetical protein J5N97_019605 [Dioscorea zingiberensis]|uniref:F-box protein n=1 Tax=Dioscorea zingiberensis TaxID=325984 RepID=A0A9D5CE68_9LILI|nr:hypothetical protein J5N97_019605 [Dioscorea zingiberensis]